MSPPLILHWSFSLNLLRFSVPICCPALISPFGPISVLWVYFAQRLHRFRRLLPIRTPCELSLWIVFGLAPWLCLSNQLSSQLDFHTSAHIVQYNDKPFGVTNTATTPCVHCVSRIGNDGSSCAAITKCPYDMLVLLVDADRDSALSTNGNVTWLLVSLKS